MQKKIFKKMKEESFKLSTKLIRDERGISPVITAIIFSAILIIAVVAMKGDIDDAFSHISDSFSSWIENKVDGIIG